MSAVMDVSTMPDTTLTPSEYKRIFKFVLVGDDGCWAWGGVRQQSGYAQVWLRGRMRQAYRVLWEHLNGPIPDGLDADHLCRNRGCVNPDHIEPVTHAENIRRRPIRERCSKGHEKTDDNVITSSLGHRICRTCRNAARAKNRQRRKALGLPRH